MGEGDAVRNVRVLGLGGEDTDGSYAGVVDLRVFCDVWGHDAASATGKESGENGYVQRSKGEALLASCEDQPCVLTIAKEGEAASARRKRREDRMTREGDYEGATRAKAAKGGVECHRQRGRGITQMVAEEERNEIVQRREVVDKTERD